MPRNASTQNSMDSLLSLKQYSATEMILELIAHNIFGQLAYISHTDIYDLSIVDICDILVYHLLHEVM